MRLFFGIVFLFSLNRVCAQQTVYPSAQIVNEEYLHDDSFTMKLYVWNDTVKMALGSMTGIIHVDKQAQQLIYIQKTRLGNFTDEWLDSVIVRLKDLCPLYYSARKPGDETMLYFKNNAVKGIWNVFNTSREITDSTRPPFFDYHFFPVLICWLPLKEGKTYEIPVYDFIVGRNGMTTVSVTKIETIYRDNKKIVKLTAKEHIRKNSGSVFYVDADTRRLLQVDIYKGERKTEMVRENPPGL